MNSDKKFRVLYISALNDDTDGLCRTLKAQYYKNNVKNLGEWGIYGCSGAIVYVEYEDTVR